MGFGERELEALKQPALASVLANADVPWCSIRVNCEIVRRLLCQTKELEQEIQAIDRMLRLGASTDMLVQAFGLSHQEIALRRHLLGLPKRRGRHPVLNEAQEAELWRRQKAELAARGITPDDEAAMLTLALDLAERMGLPASVVWTTVCHWMNQLRHRPRDRDSPSSLGKRGSTAR